MRRLIIITGFLVLFLLAVAWFWPLPKQLKRGMAPLSTRVLDRNGKLLYVRQRGGIQEPLPLRDIPREVKEGLIAVEDRTFYTHHGLSLRGIVRAFLHNLRARRVREGGSTITQQLVRTLLQPKSRGLLSKVREAWLALKLDARQKKDEILEDYLNTAYFGQQAYGIKAASRTYFDKDVSELSLGESALLVGLLNAPTSLNPFRDPNGALARRSVVLQAMVEIGVVDGAQEKEVLAEPLRLSHGRFLIRAPHFVLWQLQERESAFEGAKEVRTTLDIPLQNEVEEIVRNQLQKLADKNVSSAAVVVLDSENGDVLALLGSGDYFSDAHDGAVNVALSLRQPGSAMKPFTYALAFASALTPATTVADIETQFFTQEGNPYIPRNYDYGYHGLVRLREALANSYNIAAVKVLKQVGVKPLLEFLRSAGISTLSESPEHYGLALTLGAGEVKLLELTRAYALFARGGRTLKERTLLSDPIARGNAILDPRIAWLIADILSDEEARLPEFGAGGPLSFDFPVAAKTGTTRNSRDNWTVGFTPHRVVGVWVGNADNTPMRSTSGVTGAGPIFHDVMIAASRSLPPTRFLRPPGIVDRTICRLSGKIPTPLCPALALEHFLEGTEPGEQDDLYREIAIDRRNGLRATPDCDPAAVQKEVFAVFPPDVQQWARENGWKTPPRDVSPLCAGTGMLALPHGKWLRVTSPRPEASFLLDPLIPAQSQRIPFETEADESVQSVEWRVDGTRVGTGKPPTFRFLWQPKPGRFHVEAEGNGQRASVNIEVASPSDKL